MNKKKNGSKTTKKTSSSKKQVKKDEKVIKTRKRAPKSKKTKKKIAFTLIELLAVIIILGLLMLIAIPSVTNYINNSRKEAYIDSAKQIIRGTTTLVNSGDLDVYDPEATYYIPSTCVNLETGGKSPYGGDFAPAYIIVVYDNDTYNYYWMSRDEQGMGIRTPINSNKLKSELIESGIKESEIIAKYGIENRGKIIEFNNDCSAQGDPKPVQTALDGEGNEVPEPIVQIVTSGKTVDTLAVGDEIKIEEEHFNVISTNSTSVTMLAKYNLYVGNIFESYRYIETISESDPKYLKQDSTALGTENGNRVVGTVPFSSSCYWTFTSNDAPLYSDSQNTKPVFSSGGYINTSASQNYSVAYYVQQYKNYLIGLGANVTEARLIYITESRALSNATDSDGVKFIYNTAYYSGSSVDERNRCCVWSIRGRNSMGYSGYNNGGYYNYPDRDGVRPVIVIPKSDLS